MSALRFPAFSFPNLSDIRMAKTISNLYLITAIVTIGGLLQGFDVSSLSAIISTKPFKVYYGKPNAATQGGITASISGGSFLGCFFAFWLIDRIGRKTLLQIASVIFIVGAVLCAASVDVAMLIVGRMVCGFAVGKCPSSSLEYKVDHI